MWKETLFIHASMFLYMQAMRAAAATNQEMYFKFAVFSVIWNTEISTINKQDEAEAICQSFYLQQQEFLSL